MTDREINWTGISLIRIFPGIRAALCGCEGVKNTGQELCLYQRRFQQITGRMFGDMERACPFLSRNYSDTHIGEIKILTDL